MIDHVWTVLCRRSLIDENNNISLLEVLEQVTADGETPEPGTTAIAPISIELVTLWSRHDLSDAEQGQARVTYYSPSMDPLFQHEYEIDLLDHNRRRIRASLAALPFQNSGTYCFVVELRNERDSQWSQVARIPLEAEVRLQ